MILKSKAKALNSILPINGGIYIGNLIKSIAYIYALIKYLRQKFSDILFAAYPPTFFEKTLEGLEQKKWRSLKSNCLIIKYV